jgi:hypothetical protein
MTDFWPDGLELSDTESPMDILKDAQRNWELESKGLLTLVLQETKSSSGFDMIIVHAKHVRKNRTASLFSVLHRHGAPYPARIQPRDNDLPNFFKKSYYEPAMSSAAVDLFRRTQGGTVENNWVADTPSEFRDTLREAFNLGIVKSEVLSIAASSGASDEVDRPGNDSVEDELGPPPEGGGSDAQ